MSGQLANKPKQLYYMTTKHNPPHSYGDCLRAAIATVLQIPPTRLPHFTLDFKTGKKISGKPLVDQLRGWLNENHGLDFICLDTESSTYSEMPKGICIALANSETMISNGITNRRIRFVSQHTVVWWMDEKGGYLIHEVDKSPPDDYKLTVIAFFFLKPLSRLLEDVYRQHAHGADGAETKTPR